MTCVIRNPKVLLIGAESNISDIECEEYLSTLVRWNGQCIYQPLTTERAAWRDIPVTYIYTTKDLTVPLNYQKWFVEEMRKEGVGVQTATLEVGHCPNLTAADEVTKIVEDVVNLKGVLKAYEDGARKDDVKEAVLSAHGIVTILSVAFTRVESNLRYHKAEGRLEAVEKRHRIFATHEERQELWNAPGGDFGMDEGVMVMYFCAIIGIEKAFIIMGSGPTSPLPLYRYKSI
ncbi:hypothetical protein BKA66DRAFT_438788 [Pyrenochaeta sp. MPI-SDFR-AT-0127]|nr:hypothetical protein BKA66DRAFT_438788 [Pyrenochaeta sp. MPI-SDFR-AT-0127]